MMSQLLLTSRSEREREAEEERRKFKLGEENRGKVVKKEWDDDERV